ncbi:MAG: permease-like cell division protein FtsX, partial [Microgenomates group bacterium]
QKADSIKYVSREEALKIYRTSISRDEPQLQELVSAETLPASLEISAKKPEYLKEIAAFLQKQPGVDEVVFQKNIVDRLHTLTNVLRGVSAGIFAFLMFTSIVVLVTTTAFKIALKKDEIELLGLLGASKFYIRKPFLEEGIFFGLISGTLAFVTFYGTFFAVKPFLSAYLGSIPNLSFYGLTHLQLTVWPPSLVFIILSYTLTVAFGMIIGLLGNYFATSKYI